ncbi:MAG: alpha/beta hydrolase [candidate division NC10 bacterium]|nr:alpha/beta hydrolase [candidate division NC10 bacterium]
MLLRINGLQTHFTEEGRGDPVVLLHGWGTSSQSLAPLCGALADAYRVLAVDLPGFGWSQAPPVAWGAADYAGHVRGLLEQAGIERAAFIGHSFGGRIAITLAATRPAGVSRLVLVASTGIRPPRRAGYTVRVTTAKLTRWFFSLPGWGRTGQRIIAKVYGRFGSRDYRAAGPMRPTFVKVVNEDLTPLLPAIQAPTLILWGERDEEVPRSAMETMAARIPGSRLVVFPGAGHFPFLEAPEEFQRALLGFLRGEDRR